MAAWLSNNAFFWNGVQTLKTNVVFGLLACYLKPKNIFDSLNRCVLNVVCWLLKVRYSSLIASAPSYFEMLYKDVKDTDGKIAYGKTVKVCVY